MPPYHENETQPFYFVHTLINHLLVQMFTYIENTCQISIAKEQYLQRTNCISAKLKIVLPLFYFREGLLFEVFKS